MLTFRTKCRDERRNRQRSTQLEGEAAKKGTETNGRSVAKKQAKRGAIRQCVGTTDSWALVKMKALRKALKIS